MPAALASCTTVLQVPACELQGEKEGREGNEDVRADGACSRGDKGGLAWLRVREFVPGMMGGRSCIVEVVLLESIVLPGPRGYQYVATSLWSQSWCAVTQASADWSERTCVLRTLMQARDTTFIQTRV